MTVLYKFISPTMDNFTDRFEDDHRWYVHVSTIPEYIPGYQTVPAFRNAVNAFGEENVRFDHALGVVLMNCIYQYEIACFDNDTDDYERNMIEQQIVQLYTIIHSVFNPNYRFQFPQNGDIYFNIVDKYLMKYKNSYGIEDTGNVKHFTVRNTDIETVLGIDMQGRNNWYNDDMTIMVLEIDSKPIVQMRIGNFTPLVYDFIEKLDRNFDDDFGIRLSNQRIILE